MCIELDTIEEWEALPGSKLLAQAFSGYADNPKTHGTLQTLIFRAVLDITKSNTAAICAPQQTQTSTKTPISFLIYKLTEMQKQMLLHCRVWSSTMITFQVLPIEPACPDFLFQIKDLTTLQHRKSTRQSTKYGTMKPQAHSSTLSAMRSQKNPEMKQEEPS